MAILTATPLGCKPNPTLSPFRIVWIAPPVIASEQLFALELQVAYHRAMVESRCAIVGVSFTREEDDSSKCVRCQRHVWIFVARGMHWDAASRRNTS